jgi:hypothetical protein
MYHRHYTCYIQKELDFLKLLITRFHEQDRVNGLELDVALLKTQEIYEQLLRIKLVPEQAVKPVETQPVEVRTPEKAVVAKEKPVAKEKQEAKEQPVPATREEKAPSATAEPVRTGILAEKISPADFHPINETLAQQKLGNDLSTKLQTAPLSSIVSGIGLNDKFLYMRELFKGDSTSYSNTIRHLDTAKSLDDAMAFIHQYFDWDAKSETVQKFIHLVQRRHQ